MKYSNLSKGKRCFFILILSCFSIYSFSQETDSNKTVYNFSGTVRLTNNGIATIPAFSLGKPAVIFNLAMGNERLTFEPQFAFSTEGKPWTYFFWFRYKLKDTGKFRTRVGAQFALPFREAPVTTNNVTYNVLQAHRFGAVEVAPSYLLSENVTVGAYYLYSHGFDVDRKNRNHYLALTGSVNNIKLGNQLSMQISPQIYYLNLDRIEGFYLYSAFTLSKNNSPLSLSFIVNKKLKTDIVAGKDLEWNATLAYSFNNKFVKQ